jgi:hypothetical protein
MGLTEPCNISPTDLESLILSEISGYTNINIFDYLLWFPTNNWKGLFDG